MFLLHCNQSLLKSRVTAKGIVSRYRDLGEVCRALLKEYLQGQAGHGHRGIAAGPLGGNRRKDTVKDQAGGQSATPAGIAQGWRGEGCRGELIHKRDSHRCHIFCRRDAEGFDVYNLCGYFKIHRAIYVENAREAECSRLRGNQSPPGEILPNQTATNLYPHFFLLISPLKVDIFIKMSLCYHRIVLIKYKYLFDADQLNICRAFSNRIV